MSEKDFLSKIASEAKKPDSFKEEVRVPVQKDKKPIKPAYIIAPIVVIILLAILGWFFFLRPTIEMPNFVGKTQKDIAGWVTQQEIEKTGIIFDQEFSLEYEDGQVISQSIEEGTKVKKDVKLNFVLSKGADPDEEINVPDIANMTKDELNAWVKDNKLSKTKIVTSYSDTVEKDAVIKFEFKSCQSDNFTRGCTLNISVSKGPQPAGTITVEEFKDKSFAEAEAWAKQKKVNAEKVEVFSNDVEAGMIISQSIAKGKTMKEKETITFTVSKGKGVKVPEFNKMAPKEVDKWLEENANLVKVTKKYSTKEGYVLSQNVSSGSMIGGEDKLELTLNQGSSFYLSDLNMDANAIIGMDVTKLEDWSNNNRHLGIDSFVGQWGTNTEAYSEKYSKGKIVSIECLSYATGEKYDCGGRLPLDVRFSVVISKGLISYVNIDSALVNGYEDIFDTAKMVDLLSSKAITFANDASGDTCTLFVNGQKINITSGNTIKITEGDQIVLGYSSVELENQFGVVEPTSTPTPSNNIE